MTQDRTEEEENRTAADWSNTNAWKYALALMDRFPRAEDYPFASWSYTQGFYLWGFIYLYERTRERRFYQYVYDYGDLHVAEDGTIHGFTGCSLDDILTASVLVWLYTESQEERFRRAADRVRRVFDDYPRNPDGGFWHGMDKPGEMWVDGTFMGLMFLGMYGKRIGDREFCYGECVQQLTLIFSHCEKDHTGLLYHAWAAKPSRPWVSRITGCAPEVWSEGLGWYAMILVNVLELLPESMPGRDQLLQQLDLLVRDLLLAQDPGCGLWYQVTDKPRAIGNFHDTSGSAMFLYALAKANRLHLLRRAGLQEGIAKAYRGLLSEIVVGIDGSYHVMDACNGLGVQNNYHDYAAYPRTVDAREAVAAVLWALTEVELQEVKESNM